MKEIEFNSEYLIQFNSHNSKNEPSVLIHEYHNSFPLSSFSVNVSTKFIRSLFFVDRDLVLQKYTAPFHSSIQKERHKKTAMAGLSHKLSFHLLVQFLGKGFVDKRSSTFFHTLNYLSKKAIRKEEKMEQMDPRQGSEHNCKGHLP